MASGSRALLSSMLDPFAFSTCSSPSHLSILPINSSVQFSRNLVPFSSSSPTAIKPSQYAVTSKKTTPGTPIFSSFSSARHVCKAAEYKFPDPIPEFADAETEKFRANLLKKLSKKDVFGDSLEDVVGICTEIFSTFVHTEYGGPGTLLVLPFIDMADTINEQGLPGGPQAARAAVKWAQDHVDKDWRAWTGSN